MLPFYLYFIFAAAGLVNSGYGNIVFLIVYAIIIGVMIAAGRWIYQGFKNSPDF